MPGTAWTRMPWASPCQSPPTPRRCDFLEPRPVFVSISRRPKSSESFGRVATGTSYAGGGAFMNEFDERLRAADPAAASSYEHPDTNAMISRIMPTAPRARRHVLRSFQLRMAGSVAVAAALTVGGIAALDGAAPSL